MDTTPLPAPDDEDAHTIGRRSARRPRIELITRGERRRIWTPEQKREIVLESLDPGTTPTAVARKHAISSGLLYTWRQRLLGVQGSPMVRSSPSFARVEVTSVPASLDFPDPSRGRDRYASVGSFQRSIPRSQRNKARHSRDGRRC
jgi:transposase